jgi:hypothetical protein
MDAKRSDSNRELFVRVVLKKIKPFIAEEVKAIGADEAEYSAGGIPAGETNAEYVSLVVERLLSRFYELGAQEATMYMPLIMAAIRKADKEG